MTDDDGEIQKVPYENSHFQFYKVMQIGIISRHLFIKKPCKMGISAILGLFGFGKMTVAVRVGNRNNIALTDAFPIARDMFSVRTYKGEDKHGYTWTQKLYGCGSKTQPESCEDR